MPNIPTTPITLEQALASVEHFYRTTYWLAPTATTMAMPAYTLSYSGVRWLYSANQFWLHDPTILNDTLLKMAARFFDHHAATYNVVVPAQSDANLPMWLSERTYTEQASNPVYALTGLPRIGYTQPTIEIVRARAEHQTALLEVLYGAFFMGPETARCTVREEHFDDATIRHYLAYVEGQAAACLTLMLADGIAGVWNVGTLRPYRRRGIASALLISALHEAYTEGYCSSVLVASPMGQHLYEAMGYQHLGNLLFYGRND